MSETFNKKECIEWLESQDNPIDGREVQEKFPNFPWENIPAGVTRPIVNGRLDHYYKADLIKSAKGLPNYD